LRSLNGPVMRELSVSRNPTELVKRLLTRILDSNDLIASLKKDLADLQKRLDTQIPDLTAQHAEVASLNERNKKLEAENKTLKQTLTTAENENRTLSAKIATSPLSLPTRPTNQRMQIPRVTESQQRRRLGPSWWVARKQPRRRNCDR
jgi:cell shape-determining protein MreC